MISLDSNVLIYFLEGNKKFYDQSRKVIQRAASEGATISELVRHEILSGVALNTPDRLPEMESALNELGNLVFADATKSTSLLAARLTAQYGRKVKGYDAIHLASAIERGATEFWTNDQQLIEVGVTEISIRSL